MSIKSEDALAGTCCVCGKPINPLMGALPPLPGMSTAQACSRCGKKTCSEHAKQHAKSCGQKVKTEGTDWCKTPGLFP